MQGRIRASVEPFLLAAPDPDFVDEVNLPLGQITEASKRWRSAPRDDGATVISSGVVARGQRLRIQASQSPLVVTSSIFVEQGATLVIEPGVSLLFERFQGIVVVGTLIGLFCGRVVVVFVALTPLHGLIPPLPPPLPSSLRLPAANEPFVTHNDADPAFDEAWRVRLSPAPVAGLPEAQWRWGSVLVLGPNPTGDADADADALASAASSALAGMSMERCGEVDVPQRVMHDAQRLQPCVYWTSSVPLARRSLSHLSAANCLFAGFALAGVSARAASDLYVDRVDVVGFANFGLHLSVVEADALVKLVAMRLVHAGLTRASAPSTYRWVARGAAGNAAAAVFPAPPAPGWSADRRFSGDEGQAALHFARRRQRWVTDNLDDAPVVRQVRVELEDVVVEDSGIEDDGTATMGAAWPAREAGVAARLDRLDAVMSVAFTRVHVSGSSQGVHVREAGDQGDGPGVEQSAPAMPHVLVQSCRFASLHTDLQLSGRLGARNISMYPFLFFVILPYRGMLGVRVQRICPLTNVTSTRVAPASSATPRV